MPVILILEKCSTEIVTLILGHPYACLRTSSKALVSRLRPEPETLNSRSFLSSEMSSFGI